MRYLFFFIFIFPVLSPARSDAVPEICKRNEFQTEAYWRKRVDDRILYLTRDQPPEAVNAFVTLSYLELFRAPSRSKSASFMGYVYVNASHHLGRLPRFTLWPPHHPLAGRDRELVKGKALRLLAVTVPRELSSRLMSYSLDLYKELAWSLTAAVSCGNAYARKLVSDENLIAAYGAGTIELFLQHFISFEQTYLQHHMYQDLVIAAAARAKVLDEMRFVSFNGEEHLSFRGWCDGRDCKTSCFDWKNRISFDIDAVERELAVTGGSVKVLETRLKAASVEATARIFVREQKLSTVWKKEVSPHARGPGGVQILPPIIEEEDAVRIEANLP
jgi:hypothetical protein